MKSLLGVVFTALVFSVVGCIEDLPTTELVSDSALDAGSDPDVADPTFQPVDDDEDGIVAMDEEGNFVDCDDTDPDVGVARSWIKDSDGDGHGAQQGSSQEIVSVEVACEQPEGFVLSSDDCNDSNENIHPGAPEICNGIDDNCDGDVDNNQTQVWHVDSDGDGFGNPDLTVETGCDGQSALVDNGDDCNDSNENIHPGAPEICNGFDDNCDGLVDDDDPELDTDTAEPVYADSDGDGFGDPHMFSYTCAKEAPEGNTFDNTDCNDADPAFNPDVLELCDGVDNDCDGQIDEGVKTEYFLDSDGDGFGNPLISEFACAQPDNYVGNSDDCDDSTDVSNPDAVELCDDADNDCDGEVDEDAVDFQEFWPDNDGDGFGDENTSVQACVAPEGHVANGTDCDDQNGSINPEAAEICDEEDNDCNGATDENNAQGAPMWFVDLDQDGQGDADASLIACDQPVGYVDNNLDCDDAEAQAAVGLEEICDNVDNDCDGDTDENDAIDASLWYADDDGDGFGDPNVMLTACEQPDDFVGVAGDCNDQDASIFEDAFELCDGHDNDCDGQIDEGAKTIFWPDGDNDGFGNMLGQSVEACEAPPNHVSNNDDCNDNDVSINPDAAEVCDADDIDEDCNNLADDADPDVDNETFWLFYPDVDGDLWGDGDNEIQQCDAPEGFVLNSTDCNDNEALIHPTATEFCDGVDNDCDDEVDELGAEGETTWYEDLDGDGAGNLDSVMLGCNQPDGFVPVAGDCDDQDDDVQSNAQEVCDGEDNDCDGDIDEGVNFPTYVDVDGDGYGDIATELFGCNIPDGRVVDNTDCNDADEDIHPFAPEFCTDGIDTDCDGYGGNVELLCVYGPDVDNDGVALFGGDCNDDDSEINPFADEVCDGVDNDCSGEIDDNAIDALEYYEDADGDGHGIPDGLTVTACFIPQGFSGSTDDCNDADPDVSPEATEVCDGQDNNCDGDTDENSAEDAPTWYVDEDDDEHGNPDLELAIVACSQPVTHVASNDDCDDTRIDVFEGAPELCDGVDNDCDGQTDEGVTTTFWPDGDADGFGNPAGNPVEACEAPVNHVNNPDDCDDSEPLNNPSGVEVCDGADNDCDGGIDDDDLDDVPVNANTYLADNDGDGFAPNSAEILFSCDDEPPQGFVAAGGADDCNDADAAINPGVSEICDDNDVDENCNGLSENGDDTVDVNSQNTLYQDGDEDGFGNPNVTVLTCDSQAPGFVDNALDCNDNSDTVNPDGIEVCDGLDNDCDGGIDEDVTQTFFADSDGDTHGDPNITEQTCAPSDGFVNNSTDCDDSNPAINPDISEVCDGGIDNNCDGDADDADENLDLDTASTWYTDADNDSFGDTNSEQFKACLQPDGLSGNKLDCDDTDEFTNPDGIEVCANVVDDDCDGGQDDQDVEGCIQIGQFTGDYEVTVTVAGFDITDTCSGTVTLTIDTTQDPMIQGEATCQFGGDLQAILPDEYLSDFTGTILADFTADGLTVSQDIDFSGGWAGSFSDNATLEGVYDGSTEVNGLQVDYDGIFTGNHVP